MGLAKGTTTLEKEKTEDTGALLGAEEAQSVLPTVEPVADDSLPEVPAETSLRTVPVLQAIKDDEGTGFEILDEKLDFTSFPVATIKNGRLFLGTKQVDEIRGVIQSVSTVTIFKASKAEDAPMFYSKNGVTDNDGVPLSTYKEAWAAAGHEISKIITKEYIVGYAMQEDGEMFAFNVPPTSQGKLAGYRVVLKLRKLRLNDVVTKFSPGEMVNTADRKSFTPWAFSFVKKAA